MRKVKLAIGVWAFCRNDNYPYLVGGPVTAIDKPDITIAIEHLDGKAVQDQILFCVSADDGPLVRDEVIKQLQKHKQAIDTMTRILADQRRRSVLGQLDPMEKQP